MKNYCFTLPAVLLLFTQVLFGQEQPDSSQTLPPRFSILFQINNNFSLRNFDESSFAFQYRIADASAIRLLSQVYANRRNTNRKEQTDTSYKNLRFTISPQYLHFYRSEEKLQFYLGIGPSIMYVFQQIHDFDRSRISNVRSQNSWSIEIINIWGVTYRLTNRIRLSGEYGLAWVYKQTREYVPHFGVQNTHDYQINAQPVKLGLEIFL